MISNGRGGSYPFDTPETGKIAVKVINHGDEGGHAEPPPPGFSRSALPA
jgi:hypothetical protein